MSSPSLIETAKRWLQAGYSVIPVSQDKRAYSKWNPLRIRPYQIQYVERVFSDPRAKFVAVVCGYGGLMCFDFDADKNKIAKEPLNLYDDFYQPWRDTAESLDVIPLTQATRSGGTHAIITTEKPVGNIKLAEVEATPDPKTNKPRRHATIETRGEGGYFLIYEDLDPTKIPFVDDSKFQIMLEAAADLTKVTTAEHTFEQTQEKRKSSGAKATAAKDGLLGWFNSQNDLEDILKRNNYRKVRDKYIAPDSTSGNAGVFLFSDENGQKMCFSHHGDALGDGHAHDAFDCFKILEHYGNFESALSEVKKIHDATRFNFSEGSRAREGGIFLASNSTNNVTDDKRFVPPYLASNQNLASNNLHLMPTAPFDAKGGEQIETTSQTEKLDLMPTSARDTRAREGDMQYMHVPIKKWGERDLPPAVQWLVHHLFQDNAENLLAGEPGVGKSWISGDLAVAVATGSHFLDRPTQQGSVLVINFDDPSESLPRLFAERSARGRGYDFADLPIYYWQPDEKHAYPPFGIITPDVFEFLIEQISLIKPRLIIVDAFVSAFPGLDGNKGQDAIQAFEALRQLRSHASKPCSLVLLDHTPKATLQDSKRRGVSGSQQKHAKTRTVHIVRSVDPGDVGGDDVLEWEVFKANAAPRQDKFGIDREMNTIFNTAKLTTRDLPQTGSGLTTRTAEAAITYLKSVPGVPVLRSDLLREVIKLTGASKRSATRALYSSEFADHPGVQKSEPMGRGGQISFSWIGIEQATESFYSKLRRLIEAGEWDKDAQIILDTYKRADQGDQDALDALDAYLSLPEIRERLTVINS